MNRLDDAVTVLVAALEPVLPGRVYPTPPSAQQNVVAPAIWVDDDSGFRTTIGQQTQVLVATFPVRIVYDGADRAQVDGSRQLRSWVIDAINACPGAEVSRWQPEPVEPGTNRRQSVVDVDVTITAATLCIPEPATVGA